MVNFNWIQITRWSARVVSLLILVLLGILLVGEGFPPFSSLAPNEKLMFFGFLIMSAGLVWAWWQPMAGGALTMLGFVFFAGVNMLSSGQLPAGWVFPLFPLTGALHIVYGFQLYCSRQRQSN